MSKLKLTSKQVIKIEKALSDLESVRLELQNKTNLTVNWYVEDVDNFILMEGDTHDATPRGNPNKHMVIKHFTMKYASGGGW